MLVRKETVMSKAKEFLIVFTMLLGVFVFLVWLKNDPSINYVNYIFSILTAISWGLYFVNFSPSIAFNGMLFPSVLPLLTFQWSHILNSPGIVLFYFFSIVLAFFVIFIHSMLVSQKVHT